LIEWGFRMKVLIVSAIAAAVLLAGATGILRSRLPSAHDEMAAMPPMQQLPVVPA
jgi:hypothetical protein